METVKAKAFAAYFLKHSEKGCVLVLRLLKHKSGLQAVWCAEFCTTSAQMKALLAVL